MAGFYHFVVNIFFYLFKEDKAEALKLLTHVANAGRRYKELICESFGRFNKSMNFVVKDIKSV